MAKKKSKSQENNKSFKEYTVPLRNKWHNTVRYRKAEKAVKCLKEYMARHMKIYDRDLNKVKLDKYVNETLWKRGVKKPPAKIKVKARKNDEGIVEVKLAEIPRDIEMRIKKEKEKEKEAKKEKESEKAAKEKETSEKEEMNEDSDEAKEEEKEKEEAVKQVEKETAKKQHKEKKHTADNKKVKQVKQSEINQRKALEK